MTRRGQRAGIPRQVWVLQHVACEGLGTLSGPIEAARIPLRRIRLFAGEPVPERPGGCAGIIALGGPMSVDDRSTLRYLADELRLLERALAARLPVLGVCLGAQLLAHAAGARVFRGREPELGWWPIERTHDGVTDAVFRRFPRRPVVFQWHSETFDLPPGAVSLARSRLVPHQAFRLGAAAYGLQFHVEVTAPMVRSWVRTYRREWVRYRAAHPEALAPLGGRWRFRQLKHLATVLGAWFAGQAGSVRRS